ncbi:MAG: methyltransferase, partial [Alphaproteobacteria bacterium]|nr:methyltransferase [Alphaproteobacteria bacterium]
MSSAATTDGSLLGGALSFEQPARGYRTAIDPVMLAAAVTLARGRVLDLGAGAGAAALCLARRVAAVAVTGLEIDPETAALGARNAM